MKCEVFILCILPYKIKKKFQEYKNFDTLIGSTCRKDQFKLYVKN